jgi:protein-disulfide isomerase
VSTRTRWPKNSRNTSTYYIVGAVVAALIVAGVVIALSVRGGDESTEVADPETIAEIQQKVEGIPANGMVLGEPDAPVTITEYSDIACSFCARAAIQSVPTVVDEVVRDGRAKMEFAPTAFISASSERGALGVIAASQQDAAWTFSDALFRMQGSAATDWLQDEDMEMVAEQLGLDVDAWRAAYQSDEIVDEYRASQDAVRAAEVTSTPTFIITGPGGTERIEGAVAPAQIIEAVEKVSSPS